eukprot:GILJ01010658.1.p1 GENE.GILJ01010658.1~~GILJ01010658.1.p1  ORF type:complete len:146 (-),score=19.85 GILJ01010658.1:13-450(-)
MVYWAPTISEIGAGTGYWASLLQKMGAQVTAVDDKSDLKEMGIDPKNQTLYHPVEEMDGVAFCKSGRANNTALFFCWPRMEREEMIPECVNAWEGDTILFIGETCDGCTADVPEVLQSTFEVVESHEIPTWPEIHDSLYIMKRKK